MPKITVPDGYVEWLTQLKADIRQTQTHAVLAVNSEMIMLYWRIGREIIERQAAQGWGKGIIPKLAADLRAEFPDVKGFSARNLGYMKALAEAWPSTGILQRVIAKLPWGQNIELLDKLTDSDTRLWYAKAAIEHGWSRPILAHQIETRLHERDGRSVNNFAETLPPVQSDMAKAAFRDPYVLDFVNLAADAHERHLETALTEKIKKFLLALGKGFAFIDNQYHLEFGGEDFYLDLLFYHTRLHCYVVVDLKMVPFKAEFGGKMNLYLSIVDDQLRTEGDNPSLGLILCRGKNGLIVEYALRGMDRPIAVSDYQLLPPAVAAALPSPEDIKDTLGDTVESDISDVDR
jgi:predicted nuclease of restriction endonuclease-like (RecB) superfamily